MLYVGIPQFISKNLPFFGFPEMHKAYKQFFEYLQETINLREKGTENIENKKDLLSFLVKANIENSMLTHEQLLSNCFIFLLAGRKQILKNKINKKKIK